MNVFEFMFSNAHLMIALAVTVAVIALASVIKIFVLKKWEDVERLKNIKKENKNIND